MLIAAIATFSSKAGASGLELKSTTLQEHTASAILVSQARIVGSSISEFSAVAEITIYQPTFHLMCIAETCLSKGY